MIYLNCPGCRKRLGLDDSAAGALGECPACGKQFRVPEKSPPAEDDEPIQAEEADDEPLEAEFVDEGGERRERRPRRRKRRPEVRYRKPLYMQEPRRGGSSISGQKILGLIGLILGGLMIGGDILIMAGNTGQGGPGVFIPGGLCGLVLFLGGGYLFLRGD
jgi:hypothetical protein